MKRSRKKYKTPIKAWDKQRIESEREIVKEYGLKNKKEIWVSEGILRKFRRMARKCAAKKDKETEKVIVKKMVRLGLLEEGAGLDDMLGLTLASILGRRLQTIIFKKGFANSMKQARQLIVHRHVTVGERRTTYPSYMVSREDENNLAVDIVPQKKKAAAATQLPQGKGEEKSG